VCSEYLLVVSSETTFPSSQALAVLKENYAPGIDPDLLNTELRRQGHPPELVIEVVNQVALRQKASQKLGSLADSLLFTRAGLEQASRYEVALFHARKLKSRDSVTDLGCGLGIDSIAFASSGLTADAVESDPNTVEFALSNLANFEAATAELGLAEEHKIVTDAVFLDPARRDLKASGRSRKLLAPEDFSPSISFAFGLLAQMPGGVKLSPALPHELLSNDFEATWVSNQGDLVELSQWSGDPGRAGRKYAVMVEGETDIEFTGEDLEAEAVPVGKYVYEPDAALIRSHLIGAFASELGLGVVSRGIAYLTGAEVQSPWLRTYKVLDELPLHEKQIAGYLAKRGIGTLEIKKRGVDVEPELLRKKLKPKGSGAATLIATKVGGARKALVCEPVR
jgi:hypothetical protein